MLHYALLSISVPKYVLLSVDVHTSTYRFGLVSHLPVDFKMLQDVLDIKTEMME